MTESSAPPGRGAAGVGSPCVRPLHVSEMRTYLACPAKWSHGYQARRVPAVDATALSRGNAVHEWLAEWWMGRTGRLPLDPIARACCIGYQAMYVRPTLDHVHTNWAFTCEIGGVPCAGTLDAIGRDDDGVVIVEHKTTSEDIGPGSPYWRRVTTTDSQVSMYRAVYPGAKVLYDVIRKPTLRQKQGELDDEFVIRCIGQMGDQPEKFFQRANVVRLEGEDAAFARDVALVGELRSRSEHPRNPDVCFSYVSRCGFFEVCWDGASLYGAGFRDQEENR